MSIPVSITDGERIAILDHLTNILVQVPHAEHEIHSGRDYRANVSETVTANTFHNLTFKTPLTKWCHFNASAISQNVSSASFYQLANAPTANGTTVTPRNANRNYPDNSEMQFMFEDSTLNLTGNIRLGHTHIGAAGGLPNSAGIGGEAQTVKEWVLKPNTWYSVHLTEDAGEGQEMTILTNWYERVPETS
jgi:hypothetical protein